LAADSQFWCVLRNLKVFQRGAVADESNERVNMKIRTFAWTGILLLGLLTISSGQERRMGEQYNQEPAGKTEEDFTIRIGVEEVRLDVVVLDKKGHQITNLTAKDFEIYQDDVPMEVSACNYITDQADASQQPSVSPKASKIAPPVSNLLLVREKVRRVIAFVVDDLSMGFESMQYARTALKKYVENEMQPGDLVAILRTSRGASALQMFFSDKKQLLAMIETVRWGKNVGWDLDPENMYMIFDGQLSTLRYCIRALKDMPGRKALILMTSQSTLQTNWTDGVQNPNTVSYDQMYANSYNKMADDALRSGVVIHTMDMKGLEAPFPDAPSDASLNTNDQSMGGGQMGGYGQMGGGQMGGGQMGGRGMTGGQMGGYGQMGGGQMGGGQMGGGQMGGGQMGGGQMGNFGRGPTYGQMGGRSTMSSISQQKIERKNPLSLKTGGLFLSDRNFAGIEEVNDALKGYYLLSYVPPSTTFKANRQNIYHRTKVKVKSSGAQVHTRDGFYGMTSSPTDAAEASDPLHNAIFSPFLHSDLKVNLASGYVEDAKAGFLVRSWLHLNLNELNMTKSQKDGKVGYDVKLETVSVTSDITGSMHDSSLVHYEFRIPENSLADAQKHGMRFSLTLPVRKPGPYYLRVAVKDEISGKIGSAYQFVEIPNLSSGNLALSNLFLINRDEDAALILSGLSQKDSLNWLVPNTKKDSGKSPAVRNYHPGESFEYMSIVYNAKRETDKMPELESQYILYKDGQPLVKSEPQPVDLKGVTNLNEIPIKGKMVLEDTLQEGDYVLQLLVRDKRVSTRKSLVTQALDFNMEKPQGIPVRTNTF
jgi:VWFA-related protein